MNVTNNKHITKKNLLIIGAITLLAIDLFFYILALNNLYVFSVNISVYPLGYAIHFIYLYILLISISKTRASKVFWGVIGPFFIVPLALFGWLILFYSNKKEYFYVSSPKSTQELIIAHSNWTLGETNHYYDFYRKTALPMLKKRINKDSLHVMTHYTDANDLDVLGAYDAHWINEQTVTFESQYLNKITLNLK